MSTQTPLTPAYWPCHPDCRPSKLSEDETGFGGAYQSKLKQPTLHIGKPKDVTAELECMKGFVFGFSQSSYLKHVLPFSVSQTRLGVICVRDSCRLESRAK